MHAEVFNKLPLPFKEDRSSIQEIPTFLFLHFDVTKTENKQKFQKCCALELEREMCAYISFFIFLLLLVSFQGGM